MNAPEKKKPDACRQRALDEDRTGQGAIETKDTPQQSAKLLLMLSLLQSYQVVSCEYAMETDNPAWGAIDAADLVDAAHDEIAFALLNGGMK